MKHLLFLLLFTASAALAQITPEQYSALRAFSPFHPDRDRTAIKRRPPMPAGVDGLFVMSEWLTFISIYQQDTAAFCKRVADLERYTPADTSRASRLAQALAWYNVGVMRGSTWGDDSGEETYLLRAERLIERLDEPAREPLYLDVEGRLAALYGHLGLQEQAEARLRRVKFLCEEQLLFGATYLDAVGFLAIHAQYRDPLWSKALIDQVLDAISDGTITHPTRVLSTLQLAMSIYRRLGLYDVAGEIEARARSLIAANSLSDNTLANFYGTLADLQFAGRNYAAAMHYMREVKARKTNFYASPNVYTLFFAEHFTHDAEAPATASAFARNLMAQTAARFAFLSTEEREQYWSHNEGYVSGLHYVLSHSPAHTAMMYDLALWSKGLLLRASAHVMEQALADPSTRALAQRLQRERERLLQGLVDADSLAALRDSVARWDKQLTRAVAGYATPEQLQAEYDWRRVAAALGETDAAIEFIAMPDSIDPQRVRPEQTRYCALVLRHGDAAPRLVPLCMERELDDVLRKNEAWKTTTEGLMKYVRRLYMCGSPRLYQGDEMYRLVWAPLDAALQGAQTVYYSPVGLLNKVAFNALCHDTTYVGDRYRLRQVTSTIHCTPAPAAAFRTAYVYGGVAYMGTESTLTKASRDATRGLTRSAAAPSALPATRGVPWHSLPGTLEEQRYLDSLLRARKVSVISLDSAKANEESLKHIKAGAHELLHIGTHGYYLPADEAPRTATFFERLQDSARTDDAMLRSGLILAGGNRAWTGRDVIPGIEDGIATARELAHIDLRGTRLCVLSACETALGDIRGTEGVFGLQRALKQAGVETLVMTLWQVNDEATSLFMRTFYTRLLQTHDPHDAFRQAVETVRAQERFASPYFWAPFVMLD